LKRYIFPTILALPPPYRILRRIVLDYLYIKGYSQSEAAEALDLPLGTIKTRLRKAVNILRDELKDEKKLFLGALIFSGILLLI
jgi:DNA-directed RNA polymerase specialized sigma24 family protein